MRIKTHFCRGLRLLAAVVCLVTANSVSAQPADGPGRRGGPGGGGGFRGGPPNLSPEEITAINNFNTNLTAEALAVTLASSNLVAVTYATPKDEARIVVANQALAKAREAWAMKASALFATVQASPHKLSDDAIRQLINSAPGGGRGGGFPGGRGGPRGGAGQQ